MKHKKLKLPEIKIKSSVVNADKVGDGSYTWVGGKSSHLKHTNINLF